MNKIVELQNEKYNLIKRQRTILDICETENRTLSNHENLEYKDLDLKIDRLTKEISAAEKDEDKRRSLAQKEIELRKRGLSVDDNIILDVDPEKEFRDIGEFFYSLARFKRDGIRDERLEYREQTMGTGATGGFALPEQFDSTVRQVQSQEGVVRSRAAVIPAGSPPDAKLSFPTLDQTSAQNIYGGVTVVHTGEGVTMTETTANLREVTLEPKEISAYIVVTNKLLNNWEAAGTFLTRVLSSAMIGQEDYDFIRGDGVNKALGFINCPAAISHSRNGAGAISFPDVYNMLSQVLMRGGSYIWLASQTVIPQLAAMVDAGGHSVWLGSSVTSGNYQGGAGPLPSTLLGLPVIFSDRLPALGTKGDLSLVNLSYYLIKDGSGPLTASSEHIMFLSNKTIFKIVWNVDARPWLTEPIPLEGSTSNTVSPFVVLN